MICKAVLAIAIGSIVAAKAQPLAAQKRVLPFAQADTAQAMLEIATTLRSVADIQRLAWPSIKRTLTIDASPALGDLGEWMFKLLDTRSPGAGSTEYTVPGRTDDVVRVFFVSQANGPRELQETCNAVRSIVEVQRAIAVTSVKALVARGIVWQIRLMEWLIDRLENPPSSPSRHGQYRPTCRI